MVKPLRIGLVVVGLAVAVYGVASLTGRWLGTPPWWTAGHPLLMCLQRVPGQYAISAAVLVCGLTLALLGICVRHPLRPSLFVLGLYGAVYGVASLTGMWMGFPPWWWIEGSAPGSELVLFEGGELVSGVLVLVGLALAAFAVWPRWEASRPALGALGLAFGLYGLASLTGGWMGAPPWWARRVEDLHVGDIVVTSPDRREVHPCFIRAPVSEPSPWLDAAVSAAGLALVAFAAWPRRPKPSAR